MASLDIPERSPAELHDIRSFICEDEHLEAQPATAIGGASEQSRMPKPKRNELPAGVLKRNDTSFPVKCTAKLRELYEKYITIRATDDGWAGVLKYYQYLVRIVMSDPEYGIGADGNARGLLIYHTMGMGKTRLAVAVTMSMWDVRQPVVMLARGLQKNFRDTIEEVVAALNKDDPPEVLQQKKAAAVAKFTFVSMDAYNAADQMARVGTGVKRVRRGDLTGATGGLDNKLLVVDEAHRFFRAIINSSAENANARRMYDMVMTARNLRIIFLTGTPAAKDPFELVPCFNMLSGIDLLPTQYEIFYKLFVDRDNHAVRNRERLSNRLVGLVSHVTHLRPSEPATARQANLTTAPKKPRDDGWFPEELPTIVDRVEMGPDQYRQYLLAREKEDAEGKGGEGAGGRGSGVLTTPPLALPGSEKKAMRSYFVKSRAISTFAAPREWAKSPIDAMPEDVFTAQIAPKLEIIANRVVKAPGPVLIYSEFVDAGGLKPLGRFLQRHGYTLYVPTTANITAVAAEATIVDGVVAAEVDAADEDEDAAAATAETTDEDATVNAAVVEGGVHHARKDGTLATILPLELSAADQRADLARIGSKEAIYSRLGLGKPWNGAHIEKLRSQSVADAKAESVSDRKYYHWIILLGKKAVGYVGYRPAPPGYDGVQLRCFVDDANQGRGIATLAIQQALDALAQFRPQAVTPVISVVSADNAPQTRVVEKLGFVRDGTIKINGVEFVVWRTTVGPAGASDFPYRRQYMPPFAEMVNKLQSTAADPPTEWSRPREGRLGIVERSFPDDYESADSITDWEAEPVRVRCRERGERSPMDVWNAMRLRLPPRDSRSPTVDVRERRALVYDEARGCNLFNVTLGIHLLQKFGGLGDVLDPTAGWGDRLGAAFIAGSRSYRGWDTNAELQTVYSGLAARYEAAGLKLDWKIQSSPFENTPDEEIAKKYDTVLTSPPFFDKENYEGDKTSTAVYRGLNEWYRGFYRILWQKAAVALRPGGHVVAYIPSGRMKEEADRVLRAAGLKYVGAVGFRQTVAMSSADRGFVRDAFVWQKPATVGGADKAVARGCYAIISGEVNYKDRDAIKLAFNAATNIRGEVIKAILVSKTGAEGLDLKYLRETHQIEPYWDRARDDQVKARAVRIGCLDALPREDRVVQPYLYVAVANRKIWEQMMPRDREVETIDEQFFKRALERYKTNSAFREVLAESCLECELFGYGTCHVCVPTNAPLFHDDSEVDIRLPNPCELRRETEVKASPLKLGDVTYYYVVDPTSPLGYKFFVHREDLGGYAAIDPSDKVISELLRALNP